MLYNHQLVCLFKCASMSAVGFLLRHCHATAQSSCHNESHIHVFALLVRVVALFPAADLLTPFVMGTLSTLDLFAGGSSSSSKNCRAVLRRDCLCAADMLRTSKGALVCTAVMSGDRSRVVPLVGVGAVAKLGARQVMSHAILELRAVRRQLLGMSRGRRRDRGG